ncbi:MAG: hypothetical protein M1813_009521 [Trichoglossum hirsutum]|nr:MAG: hypothetical protein M1813_009521 [Trichoglossum hirsutum]
MPHCPRTIRTPEGIVAWYDRRSRAQHSLIARFSDIRNCTPTAPIDPCVRCPICLGVLWCAFETPCGHTFCADCLISALKTSPTCPVDRNPIPQPPNPPIHYPKDNSGTRMLREQRALRACGAIFDIKGPVKQALAELKAECPYRESEGCMAELPWDAWGLLDHITEMRHGDPSAQKIQKLKGDLRERLRALRRRVRRITRPVINGSDPGTNLDSTNTDGELPKSDTTTKCGISVNVAAAPPLVPIANSHRPLAATALQTSVTEAVVGFTSMVAGGLKVAAGGLKVAAGGLKVAACGLNLVADGINLVANGIDMAANDTNATADDVNPGLSATG